MKKTLTILFVGLCLGAGIFFRFYHLERKVFWHDEVYSKLFIDGFQRNDWAPQLFSGNVLEKSDLGKFLSLDPKTSMGDTLRGLARDDPQHPPLYYLLARFWLECFGDSIATLRLLSAVISLLAFPAMFGLGKELFGSRRAAWAGVVLIAVCPFFVLYAQEAREYSLWGVLILLSSLALLKGLRYSSDPMASGYRKWLAWSLYSLLSGLSLYTSFSTALVLIAQGIYVLYRTKFRPNKTIISYSLASAVALLLFLPWVWVFKQNIETFKATTAWAKDIVIPRLDLFKILGLNFSKLVFDVGWEYEHRWMAWVVPFINILLVYSCFELCRRVALRTSLFILLLILTPVAMLLGPDLIFGGIRSASARYLTPSFLAMELALAYLLANRLSASKTGISFAAAILTLNILSCLVTSPMDTAWTKGISYGLPQVARLINQSNSALLVGNQNSYNPGNIFALSRLLKPGVKLQLLNTDEKYVLPQGFSDLFLLNPSDVLRKTLTNQAYLHLQLLFQDAHLQLWRINLTTP